MQQPAPRWRRRKAERPRELIEAALTVFDERGFAEGRLEDVADLAGVTRATIYLYFESKEDVLRAVAGTFVPDIDKIEGALRELNDAAAETRLVRAVHLVCEALAEIRVAKTLRLVIAESLNYPDIARDYRDVLVRNAATVLAKVIRQGVKTGAFAEDTNVVSAARVAVSGALMMALYQVLYSSSFPGRLNPYADPAMVADHAETLLRGLKKR